MSKYTHHPKRAKKCVFCKFWLGDAQMQYRNSVSGFDYEATAKGKCTKKNGALTAAISTCPNYATSPDAEKLL